MRHVDEGLLHAWLDGQLDALGPGAAEEAARHLESCGECRARLEEARAVRGRAEALLRGDLLSVEIPPFEALAARAGAPARRPRRGRALAWAASVVLAVGAGWLARSSLREPEPPARTVGGGSAPAASGPVASAPAPEPTPPGTGAAPAPAEPRPSPAPATPPPVRVAAREAVEPAPGGGSGGAAPAAPVLAETLPVPTPSAPPPPAQVAAREAGPEEAARALEFTESARRRGPTRDSTAALSLEGLVVTGADGWLTIGTAEARRLLGRSPLRVRGLRVVSVQAGRMEGREVVRVRQALDGGGLLTLVQARPAAGLAPAGAAAPAAGSPSEARDDTPGELSRLHRVVGAVTVTASAPLPADSLARLLERLR